LPDCLLRQAWLLDTSEGRRLPDVAQSESAAKLNTALPLIVSSEHEIGGNVDGEASLARRANSVGSCAVRSSECRPLGLPILSLGRKLWLAALHRKETDWWSLVVPPHSDDP
jgi:hypothetical protein